MGVLVVNPQDCLQNPLQRKPYPPHMKFPRNPNPNNYSRPNRAQSNRRKRSPNTPSPPRAATPKKNLVMGEVKILKRGEEYIKPASKPVEMLKQKESLKNEDLGLGSTDRLGPDPELVGTQIRLTESNDRVNGFYAGSAFITSPPPSSLPLPGFFAKKTSQKVAVDPSSEICRLLGLNL